MAAPEGFWAQWFWVLNSFAVSPGLPDSAWTSSNLLCPPAAQLGRWKEGSTVLLPMNCHKTSLMLLPFQNVCFTLFYIFVCWLSFFWHSFVFRYLETCPWRLTCDIMVVDRHSLLHVEPSCLCNSKGICKDCALHWHFERYLSQVSWSHQLLDQPWPWYGAFWCPGLQTCLLLDVVGKLGFPRRFGHHQKSFEVAYAFTLFALSRSIAVKRWSRIDVLILKQSIGGSTHGVESIMVFSLLCMFVDRLGKVAVLDVHKKENQRWIACVVLLILLHSGYQVLWLYCIGLESVGCAPLGCISLPVYQQTVGYDMSHRQR